ncbi:MAG: hypothetical protein GXO77_11955 [Calditrichaeota bacterium]|nr:hypothetical protein [Calditrichota bacterium]
MRNLVNGNKLPVVFSTNCKTGWIDNETDDLISDTEFESESFAEAWIRNFRGGAIGVFASTRISYSGYNDALAKGFFDAIWTDFLPFGSGKPILSLGQVLNYGKMYMAAEYSSGSKLLIEFEEFHYFGDPATQLRTRFPKHLSLNRRTPAI